MLGHALRAALEGFAEVAAADVGECDITRLNWVMRYVAETAPSVVINAAARTDVDGCEKDRRGAFAVNAEGAANVALSCREQGVRLVHLSTDYVFDGLKGSPYTEGDPPNPQSAYGKSKLCGEDDVRRIVPRHIVVRTSWLFGPRGKNFIDTILAAAASRNVLQVVSDQKGSPTYVNDLAEAIRRLIETDYRGTVNVTNRGVCSWSEYARAILEIAGVRNVTVRDITTAALSRAAPRPPFSALDGALYDRLTGHPMRQWRDAVEDYIKRARPNHL